MSTSSESRTKRAAARRKDRRDVAAPRLQYEALVEVGADAGGFEAESVDVSLDGMRMRTAYMPDIGQTLMCRFDGFGGEIAAEAEVVWLQKEARGGEFGIRFVGLDAHALTLLNELCNTDEVEEEADPSVPSAAAVGTRVRLHIEGLGSPMRARVRDAADGEVLIGSNLEFLKVGRGVELEDVEDGRRKVAHIEHVGVDVDPESNIPQLVVALSYRDVDAVPTGVAPRPQRSAERELPAGYSDEHHGELTTAPYRTKVAAHDLDDDEDAESTPEPTVIDKSERPSDIELDEDADIAPRKARSARSARVAHMPPRSVQARAPEVHDDEDDVAPEMHDEVDEDDDDEEIEQMVGGSRLAARRAKEHMGAFAKKLGPRFASAGTTARGVLGSFLSTVKDKQAARREAKAKADAPKRVTAPAPTAGKRAGRRALRDQRPRSARPSQRPSDEPVSTDLETDEEEVAPDNSRRRTVVSAVLAAAAVLCIYFVSTQLRGMVDAPATSPDGAVVAATGTPTATPNTPQTPNFPSSPQGDATANVPLFGATPLSTTEAVPAPPGPGEAAMPGEAAPGPGGAAAKPAAGSPAASLESEWGVGEVAEPTVLRLKMDGKIAGISGTETASGFTITIPGRKSVSSAAGLARKDKRIDSVNVVNYPDRAEVTLHFKKDVPAFMVRAKGKRLIIEIATAKKKKKKKSKKKKRR